MKTLASTLVFPPAEHSYTIKPAGPLGCFILNRLGFAGITTPTRTIYLLPSQLANQSLINHELAHIAQLDRDGELKFWFKIVFDYFYYGYKASPYEIEARSYEEHHDAL